MRLTTALLLALVPFTASMSLAAEPPAPSKAAAVDEADAAVKDKDAKADKAVKTDPTAKADKTVEPAASTAAAKQEPATAEKSAETGEKTDAKSPKGPSPQRFIPSEQVRADFDVSFPIDI